MAYVRRRSMLSLAVVLVALVIVPLTVVPEDAGAQVNLTGQWSTLPYLVPINPIHVALLPNGKVLIVAGSENDSTSTTYKYAIWNPAAGTFTQATTPWDLFCNGMSYLPDGRLILTGGNMAYEDKTVTPNTPWRGLSVTTIFDPATEKFIQVENMAHGRWYPTNTFIGDGTMTFSGLDENGVMNQTVEIYDVGAGWSPEYPTPFTTKWYPRMHLLGNGKVINTGPDPATHTFNPAQGTWSGVMATTNYPQSRVYGSSVLLPLKPDDGYAHRIVIFGGNTAGATNTVESIDTSVFPEVWTNLPPMQYARTTMNAVLLPNGKIVALGGSQQFNTASTAAKPAEMYDPVAKTWAPAGTMAYARMYHSSALLLPDATVWVAGSNPSMGVWEPHMEIYKPPYLFTATGAPATRPTITALPAVVGYNQTFTISTPDAASIKDVVLMRPGSNTHSFDQEQRMIYTAFTKGAGTLTVTTPNNMFAAPAGSYMVFLINTSGVPSVAKFTRLAKNPTNQPPTATITNPTTGSVTINAGQSVTFAGTGTDPDGTVAVYQWNFPGGSPAASYVQNPGAVTFATPGTYTASLTVLDNLGDNNVSPPTVTVTVQATANLTAAITAPANGATVSGAVTVSMSATNAQGSPTQFLLKLDNTTTLSNQSIPGGSTATYNWNTAGVTNGAHTLNLTVTDGAGRTATTSVTVTVSNGGGGGPTGPSVAITSPFNGDWVGNSVQIKANASSSATLVNLKAYGNGGVVATVPCSSTTCTADVWWVTGPLPPAKYQIQVVATDSAGGCTVSAAVGVNKDATTPVVASGASCPAAALGASITSPANGATVSGASVAVSMAASNAQGTPTQFVLKLDNTTTLSTQSVASGSTASYTWNTTGVTNGSHTLNLTVTDGAGRTATASITVTVSNTAAALGASITSPANGATVSGASVAVNMAASNAQGTPTQFVLKLDNTTTLSTQSVASGSTASYTWNTTGVANGTHTLDLTVTDSAGRTATASITVTVSNTAAALGASITSPANGATVSGATVAVNMAASNAQGTPTQFVLKLDNTTTLSSQSVASGSTASYTWNTTGVANGAHTLDLTVTDGAGRTANASVSVTVSNSGTPPPTVTITTPFNGDWVGNSVEIKANASGSVALANLKVYGNGGVVSTVTCGATTCAADVWWVTGSLPPAAYTIQVVATDSAGGCTVSAPVTINKDATAPTVASGATCGGGTPPPALGAAITSPANGSTATGSVTVNMSATNAQGSPTQFLLQLDGVTTLSSQSVTGSTATYAWNSASASNGAHTLNLTVTDGAGRTATAAVSVTVSNATGGGDTVPPSVTITSPPNGAWTGNSIDVHVSGSDNVGLTNIKVYGDGALVDTIACGGTATCTGVVWWLTGSLASGTHTITAVATDTSNNQTTSAPVTINK